MEEFACSADSFALNSGLDAEALNATFRRDRRLRIADFLAPPCALALYRDITRNVEWRAFLVADGKILASPHILADAYPREFESMMQNRAYTNPQNGYSYFYEANRLLTQDLPKGSALPRLADTEVLKRLSEFLNSKTFLHFAQIATGIVNIGSADIQVKRYRKGHFSGFSNGSVAPDRLGVPLVAFSINLTTEWIAEWGGLLEFRGKEGFCVDAYVPSFNVLDIYALPQGSWVSAVAPFANGVRLTIDGRLYAHTSMELAECLA